MSKVLAFLDRVAPFLLSEGKRASIRRGGLPRTLIADVRDGELVRIVGHVRRLRDAVKAPISGKLCFYYQAHVVVWESHDATGEKISPLDVGPAPDGRDFFVEDESGVATISTLGTQMELPASWQDGFHPGVIQYLETNGRRDVAERLLSTKNLDLVMTKVRHCERLVSEGMPVSVRGWGRWTSSATDPATAALRGAGKHLVIEGSGGRPPLVSGHLADWIEEYPRG